MTQQPAWAREEVGLGVHRCPLPCLTQEMNGWPEPGRAEVCERSEQAQERYARWVAWNEDGN